MNKNTNILFINLFSYNRVRIPGVAKEVDDHKKSYRG